MNEIETIVCQLLQCKRGDLYLNKDRVAPTGQEWNRLERILEKRVQGAPLQYLLGETEFFGIRLCLKPGVLIPRPETETLVSETLQSIQASGKTSARILDIGTGSGNIAIACAVSEVLKEAEIYAVDISPIALKQAKLNARLNGVAGRIKFLKSDLFSCFKKTKQQFDFIVSNPPYIADDEFETLPLDVQAEPRLALLAQAGGFYFYRSIEQGSRTHLVSGGYLFLEIGHDQAPELRKIFSDSSVWQESKIVKDLCGRDRVVIIRKK
jgi:release factor glutamine methyltransferase